MQGWIKLHRKMLTWEWYHDTNVMRVFIHLLLLANHEPKRWMGNTIEEGQLITSYQHLSNELNLGVQIIRTAISKLKSTNELTIKSNNKFTWICINKWKNYQQPTNGSTLNQQTTNKQPTTTNKEKNYRSKERSLLSSVAEEKKEDLGENQIFNVFYETINKQINFGNRGWREAAKDLIKNYGLEETVSLAKLACQVQGQPFAPTITNPYQLKEKLASLQIFIKKNLQPQKGAIQSL